MKKKTTRTTSKKREWFSVYVCNQFTGRYPVGTAAVIVARNQQHAAVLLNAHLKLQGLPGDATTPMMTLLTRGFTATQKFPKVMVLCDGDY